MGNGLRFGIRGPCSSPSASGARASRPAGRRRGCLLYGCCATARSPVRACSLRLEGGREARALVAPRRRPLTRRTRSPAVQRREPGIVRPMLDSRLGVLGRAIPMVDTASAVPLPGRTQVRENARLRSLSGSVRREGCVICSGRLKNRRMQARQACSWRLRPDAPQSPAAPLSSEANRAASRRSGAISPMTACSTAATGSASRAPAAPSN